MSRCCCRAPCCRAKSRARSPSRLLRPGWRPCSARAQLIGDSEADAPPHVAWLAEHLFQHAAPLATAPYAYADLTGHSPADDHFLWHADAVHLELARDHLVLMPLPTPPSDDEASALIATANALAADAGGEFERIRHRWFLRTQRAWDLAAVPLAAAVGQPVACRVAGGPRRKGVEPAADRAPDDVARASGERGARGARRADREQRVAARRRPLDVAAAAALLGRSRRRSRVARSGPGGRTHRLDRQRNAERQRADRVVRPPRAAPAA